MMDDGLSMVRLAVMRLWVMAKVKVFDAGRIRIGYILGSASMLVSSHCTTPLSCLILKMLHP